jgi:hypothetical protein
MRAAFAPTHALVPCRVVFRLADLRYPFSDSLVLAWAAFNGSPLYVKMLFAFRCATKSDNRQLSCAYAAKTLEVPE